MPRIAVDPAAGNPSGYLKTRALTSAASEAGCSPGDVVINAEQLEAGDILLFRRSTAVLFDSVVKVQTWEQLSDEARPYSHCAMYLAHGRIIHAVPMPALSRGFRSGIVVDNVFDASLRTRPVVALRAPRKLEHRQTAAIIAATYVHRGYNFQQAARIGAYALARATSDNRYLRVFQKVISDMFETGLLTGGTTEEDQVDELSQNQICSDLIMSAYTVAFPKDNPAIPDGGGRQWGALPGDFYEAADLEDVSLELARL